MIARSSVAKFVPNCEVSEPSVSKDLQFGTNGTTFFHPNPNPARNPNRRTVIHNINFFPKRGLQFGLRLGLRLGRQNNIPKKSHHEHKNHFHWRRQYGGSSSQGNVVRRATFSGNHNRYRSSRRQTSGAIRPPPKPTKRLLMPHDMEVAIREGATYVRVGTDIFGARTT